MSKLVQFLTNNNVEGLTKDVVISERFKDSETGKLLKFKIQAMQFDEFSNIQKTCTKTDKKGKVDFNAKLLNDEIISKFCIEPDFRNAEFLKSNGCMNPAQLINKVLLAGEVSTLAEEIISLSGFNQDLDSLREEGKN